MFRPQGDTTHFENIAAASETLIYTARSPKIYRACLIGACLTFELGGNGDLKPNLRVFRPKISFVLFFTDHEKQMPSTRAHSPLATVSSIHQREFLARDALSYESRQCSVRGATSTRIQHTWCTANNLPDGIITSFNSLQHAYILYMYLCVRHAHLDCSRQKFHPTRENE